MVIQVKIKSREFSSARQHSYFAVTHCENSEFQICWGREGGGQGRTPHMKWVGMLVVVSLRGVNVGFWSHLGGVLGKTPSYLAVKVSFRVAREKIYKYIFDMYFFVVSFRGQKNAWATPRPVSFRGFIQNFRRASSPLSYAESPPPPPGKWKLI